MKTFKSIDDLEQIGQDHPAYHSLKELIEQVIEAYTGPGRPYRPEDDGYVALVEEADADRILDDLLMPYRLSEVPWEGVSKLDGHFYALYLANNQFGIGFLIPDTGWVNGSLRRALEENLDT